jgi:hypothetical protein
MFMSDVNVGFTVVWLFPRCVLPLCVCKALEVSQTCGLGGVVVSVLATGPKDRGFKSG